MEDEVFTAQSPTGKTIRTHRGYWVKIKNIKHQELKYDLKAALNTLATPDSIHKSLKDDTMQIFYKSQPDGFYLICVVKMLNGDGFLATAYQTKRPKPKGDLIWQK